jgi:hypothetical protein
MDEERVARRSVTRGPTRVSYPPSEPRDGWFVDRSLPVWIHEAVDTLDVDTLVKSVVDRCAESVFGQHSHDRDFMDHLTISASQNAYALRDVLVGRLRLGDVPLDHVLSFATVQAQLRIPQMSMQRSYRISFYLQWEVWTAHLRSHMETEQVSREDAAEALSQLTRILLSYQDHVASRVAEAYTRDYEALNRSRTHVRRTLVRDIIRGDNGALTASDVAILAYPLEAHHVAVLFPTVAEGAATQIAEGLRTATEASRTLLYPLALTSTVVWLAHHHPWGDAGQRRLRAVLEELGVAASVSNPATGLEGFRDTLRQTRKTERVRAAWGHREAPRVISHADAGLEILLLQDPGLARVFVETELGRLASETSEMSRLRDTMEASFRYGSHVAAAERLGLHEHTVRNRLHKVEEILGRPLQERRTELQVAMRLLRLLGDPLDPGPVQDG